MALGEILKKRPFLKRLRGQEEESWTNVVKVEWYPDSMVAELTLGSGDGRVSLENIAYIDANKPLKAKLGELEEYGERTVGNATLEFLNAEAWIKSLKLPYEMYELIIKET